MMISTQERLLTALRSLFAAADQPVVNREALDELAGRHMHVLEEVRKVKEIYESISLAQ